jgi:hypothetical protein
MNVTRPFLPSDRPRAATYLERAVTANALAAGRFEPTPERVARDCGAMTA